MLTLSNHCVFSLIFENCGVNICNVIDSLLCRKCNVFIFVYVFIKK